MIKRKTIPLTDGENVFVDCTAVAVCAEDTERQNAVLFYRVDGYEFSLIFGCTVDDLPDSPEEMERFLVGERDAVSSDQEDLDTVLVDGLPLDAYVWD